eukprot:scaffold167_cov347-Prasinococcus_capsulatus_cf.AAC.8
MAGRSRGAVSKRPARGVTQRSPGRLQHPRCRSAGCVRQAIYKSRRSLRGAPGRRGAREACAERHKAEHWLPPPRGLGGRRAHSLQRACRAAPQTLAQLRGRRHVCARPIRPASPGGSPCGSRLVGHARAGAARCGAARKQASKQAGDWSMGDSDAGPATGAPALGCGRAHREQGQRSWTGLRDWTWPTNRPPAGRRALLPAPPLCKQARRPRQGRRAGNCGKRCVGPAGQVGDPWTLDSTLADSIQATHRIPLAYIRERIRGGESPLATSHSV